jgi:hypothetical protein
VRWRTVHDHAITDHSARRLVLDELQQLRSAPWRLSSVYGYARSATLDDDATINDTTRNDATHDDLAPPDDDDTSNVKRKRRLEGLALAVCFIPKSQTCNSYKLNSFR